MRKHDIETRMNRERYICCHSRQTDSPLVRALYRLRKSIIIIVFHSSSSSSIVISIHHHLQSIVIIVRFPSAFLPLFSLLSSALPLLFRARNLLLREPPTGARPFQNSASSRFTSHHVNVIYPLPQSRRRYERTSFEEKHDTSAIP